MKNLPCQKRRHIVKISSDGSKGKVYRCANSAAIFYNKDVSKAVCVACSLRRPLIRPVTCKELPPNKAIWPEPHFDQDHNLIYSLVNRTERPPCPQGYIRKDNGWKFKSIWKPCPFRQFMNVRTPKGNLQLKTHCTAQKNKLVSYDICKKCLSNIKSSVPKTLSVPETPGATKLLTNYWKAVKKWIAAGRPTRDIESVQKIHKEFCTPCDWYDSKSQRCKGCGCQVKAKGMALLNKIKMKTEHCPRGYW